MANTLLAQFQASQDPTFNQKVTAAIDNAAAAVYSEATTLNGNLQSGVAVTSIPVTPNLGASIAAGTVIAVGTEDAVVAAGGAASGAAAIPVNSFTPTRNHVAGEFVSPPAPANHAARANFADIVSRSPSSYVVMFALAIASTGSFVDNTSTDAAIEAGVSSVWNLLANA